MTLLALIPGYSISFVGVRWLARSSASACRAGYMRTATRRALSTKPVPSSDCGSRNWRSAGHDLRRRFARFMRPQRAAARSHVAPPPEMFEWPSQEKVATVTSQARQATLQRRARSH